jgi:hypothetical protein
MNPVAMQEVNRARHQDRQRASEARHRTTYSDAERRGLIRALLERLREFSGRERRYPALKLEEKRGV